MLTNYRQKGFSFVVDVVFLLVANAVDVCVIEVSFLWFVLMQIV